MPESMVQEQLLLEKFALCRRTKEAKSRTLSISSASATTTLNLRAPSLNSPSRA
jgi:hypothetical protein